MYWPIYFFFYNCRTYAIYQSLVLKLRKRLLLAIKVYTEWISFQTLWKFHRRFLKLYITALKQNRTDYIDRSLPCVCNQLLHKCLKIFCNVDRKYKFVSIKF